jgi:signal transduction histidine kinase
MIVGGKVLGVFDVQSDRVAGFTGEDASIYTTLASQVAVALQNARLYAEQAATVTQLRELDRLKTSFLANMSHELRTPLNSILGFADVILNELDGPLTENMTNDLQLIHKNGQHLLSLINNVLDMAKIEAGKMSLSLEKFKLDDVIKDVVSISAPMVNEKNVALYVEDDSDQETEVEADRIRIRQVMLNLVGNSVKFTEKGHISVRADRQGDKMLIRVQDTGIGIPSELQENIFQEFTQVDSSATRKVGGTGLGLPISRRLIEMHGGRLWVESTGVPGEGSNFFVELPIVAQVTEPVEVQEK